MAGNPLVGRPVQSVSSGQSVSPVDLQAIIQAIAAGAFGGGLGNPQGGGRMQMDPGIPLGINRTPPGKVAAEVAPAGREFRPGIGSDAVAGGTASMQGGNVVTTPAPAAPAQGQPGQEGTMPNMVPAGQQDQNAAPGGAGTDQLGATDPNAAAPGAVQGGVMNALGLSGWAPTINSVGAGMAAGAGATNFAQALAQGFGGASAYYTKQDELNKQRAIEQAQRDREDTWKQRNYDLSVSKEDFDRKHTMAGEQLARDTLDATVSNREDERARKEDEDYDRAKEAALKSADNALKDNVMLSGPERDAAYDAALKKARQNRGLSYGTGMSVDDPFVPSTNKRHQAAELADAQQQAIKAGQLGHIVQLPDGRLARFDPSLMQWRPVAQTQAKT